MYLHLDQFLMGITSNCRTIGDKFGQAVLEEKLLKALFNTYAMQLKI